LVERLNGVQEVVGSNPASPRFPQRIRRHNSGHSKATRHGVQWTLLHSDSFLTRHEALDKERHYKTGKGRDEFARLAW
jgi:predicted GIY-YIG superfamily endonuclease